MSSELASSPGERRGIDRRTLVKGAAWAVPVVAIASAMPMASASGSGSAQWTNASAQLLTLSLLTSGQPVADVNLLPSAPTELSISAVGGVVPNVRAEVRVQQNAVITVGLGIGTRYLRGFSPYSIPGATAVAPATITDRSVPAIGLTAFYAQDTVRHFVIGDVPNGTTLPLDINWGATAIRTGAGIVAGAINLAQTYAVTVVITSNGNPLATLNGTISIPANANLL